MAGEKSDNNSVERVCVLDGYVDVELDGKEPYLGVFEGSGKPYVRLSLGDPGQMSYICDLIGALNRLKAKMKRANQ